MAIREQMQKRQPEEHYRPHMHEGKVTSMIERRTAKVPSGGYLSLAVGSMLLSAGLNFWANKRELANFVGLWAPTILLLGLYNKMVKQEEEM